MEKRSELASILPVWIVAFTLALWSLSNPLPLSAQTINTAAGSGAPAFSYPEGVATDRNGAVFIADSGNRRVLRMAANGVISVTAGTGIEGSSGDGGLATAAQLRYPVGLAVEANGNLFIADPFDHRVRRVASNGVISTVAGRGAAGFSGDGGLATAAQLNFPVSVAVDAIGNLFVADYYNHRVRRIAPSGVISTIAGTGVAGSIGDGGPATAAQLRNPHGVAVDAAGNVFIAEELGHRIRKVSTAGTISTIVGDGTSGAGGDNGPAATARLSFPHAVATDASGNLFIADTNNHRIRRVSAAGVISTIAGAGMAGFTGDGGLAISATLNSPKGLAVDSAGNVFIADTNNHRIRKVAAVAGVPMTYLNFARPLASPEFASTGIAILNPSSNAATVALTLFSLTGTEMASWRQTVGPGRQIARLASEFFPNVAAAGWIQLQTTEPAVQAFWVSGNFQTKVDGAEAVAARTDQVLPMITFQTEIDIVNPSASPLTVSARLVYPSGASAAVRNIVIPPFGGFRDIAWEVFDDVSFDPGAYVRLQSPAPFAAASVVEGFFRAEDTAVLNALETFGPTEINFPHVVSGAIGGAAYTTVLGVISTAARAQNITITFTHLSGNRQSAQRTLQAGGAFQETLTSLFGNSSGFQDGWIQVLGEGGITGFAAYADSNAGGVAVVANQRTPQTSLFFGHIADLQPWLTGIAILNSSSTAAQVEVYAMNPDGSTIGGPATSPRAAFTLPAGMKKAALLSELIPQTQSRTSDGGFVWIRSTNDVPLYALELFFLRQGTVLANVSALSPPPSGPGTFSTPVRIGAEVPASVQQTLTATSVVGVAPAGQSLLLPASDGGQTLVFAVNARDEIILIGYGDRNGTYLDTRSTAVALVRVGLGPYFTNGFFSTESKLIEEADSFATLHQLVLNKVQLGLSPVESADVIQVVAQVAREVAEALNQFAATPADPVVSGVTTVARPLPYYFLRSPLINRNLWLDDVQGPGISLFNRTRLTWQATSRDERGNFIAKETLEWLPFSWWELVPYGTLPTITALLGNSTKFTVTLEQTRETRQRHVTQAVAQFFVFLASQMTSGKGQRIDPCLVNVAEKILNDKFPDAIHQPSGAALVAYLKAAFPLIHENPDYWYGLLKECGVELPTLSNLSPFIGKAASLWSKIKFAVDAGPIGEFTYQMITHWEYSQTVQVCKSSGVISDCPTTIPSSGVFSGPLTYIQFNARDAQGNQCRLDTTINLDMGNINVAAMIQNGGTALGTFDFSLVTNCMSTYSGPPPGGGYSATLTVSPGGGGTLSGPLLGPYPVTLSTTSITGAINTSSLSSTLSLVRR